MTARFEGGKNIALKVPAYEYEKTVYFYKTVLGLEQLSGANNDAVGFIFGPCNLWIDKCSPLSQAEIWLEIVTEDTEEAVEHFDTYKNIKRCDEIEELGNNFDGFWISSPANIVHLVGSKKQS